jgi:uncharacterized repeat protein (TIGR01451 family)
MTLTGCQNQNEGGRQNEGARQNEVKAQPAPASNIMESRATPAPASTGLYRPNAPGMKISELAFPTGDVRSSALLVHQVMPPSVRVGQPYNYEIHVTNITGGTLQNVVVMGESMSNFSGVTSNPQGTSAGGKMTWTLGALNAGETRVIKINGKPDAVGVSSACVTVSYNNTLCIATNVVEPKIEIVKAITPESTLNCTPIEMTITVKNPGTGAAENVVVKDTLPAGLTTADGKSTVELPFGTLAPGESKPMTVALKASKTGKFDNQASVTAAGGLSANSNTVSTVVRQPVLEIACKAPEGSVIVGRDATFTLTVSNKGDVACGTTVSVPVPAGSTFTSASDGGAVSGGSIVWNVGNLAPNASKTLTFAIKPTGPTTVQATASCQCAEPKTTTCSTNVRGVPALLLDGVDDPDPILVGETTTYTLRVTNQGFAQNLTNVTLVCTMDDAMQFVSAAGPTGAGTVNGKTITFPAIATLAPKETREYKIVIRATAEKQVSFRAEAKSAEITVPLIKSETTNFYK